ASHPKGERIRLPPGKARIGEGLVQIEVVAVSRARAAIAAILQAALELSEEAEGLAEMSIGVKHVTLEEIAVVILGSAAPEVVVIVLVAFPNFAAQRQIRIPVCIERNELDGIEVVRALGWIAQAGIIFVLTKLFERWRIERRGCVLRERAERRGKH